MTYQHHQPEMRDNRIVLGPTSEEVQRDGLAVARFLSDLQAPLARELGLMWFEKARQHGVLVRDDFSFEALAPFARRLVISKKADADWLLTYCGEDISEMLGFDPTGQILADFNEGPSLEWWLNNLKNIADNRPFVEYFRLGFANKGFLITETLNLPLSAARDQEPDMALVYLATFDDGGMGRAVGPADT